LLSSLLSDGAPDLAGTHHYSKKRLGLSSTIMISFAMAPCPGVPEGGKLAFYRFFATIISFA
jgi:hypothetical protein